MKRSSNPFYCIDGKLVAANRASIRIRDLSFSRGYGAFDSMRTYHGVPHGLDMHLKRLQRSAKLLHLQFPVSKKTLARDVLKTLRANRFPESLIKIYLTGCISNSFLPEQKPSVVICVEPFQPYPVWQYEKGIALATSPLARTLPEAKSTAYLSGVHGTIQARRQGMDEVVFVDKNNAILEGSTFNVFAVIGRKLVTASKDVLSGITAQEVIRIARKHGFTILRRPITPRDLQTCSEMFITSSIRELLPIVRVNHRRIGQGKPGPVYRELHVLYRHSAEKNCQTI